MYNDRGGDDGDGGAEEHADTHRLSERMAQVARDLKGQVDPEDTYALAAQLAVTNVDGCDAAGLTMVRRRREVENRGATSESVRTADRLQYELEEGPCLDAAWQQPVVDSADLASDPRWPTWGPVVVRETGLASVLSLRLFTNDDTLGALNLYSRRRDGFTEADREEGLTIAAHIAVAIAGVEQVTNMTIAMGSRSVIGQATGIVMERYGLSADIAFATLARISSMEEVKLRDVAVAVVAGKPLPGTQ